MKMTLRLIVATLLAAPWRAALAASVERPSGPAGAPIHGVAGLPQVPTSGVAPLYPVPAAAPLATPAQPPEPVAPRSSASSADDDLHQRLAQRFPGIQIIHVGGGGPRGMGMAAISGSGLGALGQLLQALGAFAGSGSPFDGMSAPTHFDEPALSPAQAAREMRRIHGPTYAEVEASGNDDARVARYWPYARNPEMVLSDDPAYFHNAESGHNYFFGWFSNWLRGKPTSFEDWKSFLRQRHRIASGDDIGTYHEGPGGYLTDEIFPGHFRDEAEIREGNVQTGGQVAVHVDRWLKANGFPVPEQANNRQLEIRGMKELLVSQHRELLGRTFATDVPWGTIQYPHGLDTDLFLTLGWERLNEAKDHLLALLADGRGPPATPEILDHPLFDALADYYHTTATGHYFHKVNNSAHMTELFTFFETLNLPPVVQGSLDIVAIRMDYRPFRAYFRQFLLHYLGLQKLEPATVTLGQETDARSFRVGEKIGEGYMASVYEVFDNNSGERFAAKVLSQERLAEGWQASLQTEHAVLAQNIHPRIPKTLGLGRIDGGDFDDQEALIMEFVPGKPLSETYEPIAPREPQTALRIFAELLHIAESMRLSGKRYNDFTPTNVMTVDDDPETVVLIDHGNVTPLSTVFEGGNRYYSAPELISGRTDLAVGKVTSDVWSLGGLLQLLLTGRHPLDLRAWDLIPKLTVRAGLRRSALHSVVDRAMHPNPAKRYQNFSEFLDAIEPFIKKGS
jgi:hypothetical protein